MMNTRRRREGPRRQVRAAQHGEHRYVFLERGGRLRGHCATTRQDRRWRRRVTLRSPPFCASGSTAAPPRRAARAATRRGGGGEEARRRRARGAVSHGDHLVEARDDVRERGALLGVRVEHAVARGEVAERGVVAAPREQRLVVRARHHLLDERGQVGRDERPLQREQLEEHDAQAPQVGGHAVRRAGDELR